MAARPASTMRQYMIASTVTEAPSFVRVCSAWNDVVTTRVSIVKGVCSMYGSRKKMPGPRTPPKRPRRSTTLRSHSLQIRSDERMVMMNRIATTMPATEVGVMRRSVAAVLAAPSVQTLVHSDGAYAYVPLRDGRNSTIGANGGPGAGVAGQVGETSTSDASALNVVS